MVVIEALNWYPIDVNGIQWMYMVTISAVYLETGDMEPIRCHGWDA